VPLFVKQYFGRDLVLECNVAYDFDLADKTPKSWTVHVFKPRTDKTRLKIEGKVTLAQLNPHFDAGEFDFVFPIGTFVNDLLSRPETWHIVTNKGKVPFKQPGIKKRGPGA
jgi:hypothetical protein